jgi:predicted nucleic acid-binding protein
VIVCDTSGLVAVYSAADRRRVQIANLLSADAGGLILSPFVLAELDYLVARRAGARAELKILGDVADGVYTLATFGPDDVAQAAALVQRYRAMDIGLTDASLVVLAARYSTTRLLTLDEKHFRAIRPLRGDAFTILPADA